MSRMSIFLLVALLLGFSLLFARFKGHEMEYGGIGRYRDRGDNGAAWKPYERYAAPSPEAFLRDFCRRDCPDSTYARKFLPDDNFRHILLSLRKTDEEHHGDPVEAYVDAVRQEHDIPIQGRLDGKSTLGDVLVVLNELLGPGKLEQASRDSIYRAKKEALEWEREHQANRAKDSLLQVELARARNAAAPRTEHVEASTPPEESYSVEDPDERVYRQR